MPEERETTEVTVRFSWYEYGEITLDDTAKLKFPKMPAAPGLYRLRFVGAEGAWTRAYIGEAGNFQSRARGYRAPGTDPKRTNFRVNGLLREHHGSGKKVEVALVTDAVIQVAGEERTLDLDRKSSRLLVENAALLANRETEPLENLVGIGDHAV